MQLVKLSLDGKISFAGSSSLYGPKLSIVMTSHVFKRQKSTYAIYRSSGERRPRLSYSESSKRFADLVVSKSVKNPQPSISMDPNVWYHIHNNLLLVRILSQINL